MSNTGIKWSIILLFQLCLEATLSSNEDISHLDRSPEAHRRHRARQREMRKQEIKNYIERSFEDHWKQNTMPDLPIGEKVRESVIQLPDMVHTTTTVAPELFSSDYTERVQSFFPECNYHHRTNLLLQCPPDPKIDLHFYNIKFPINKMGSSVKVNEAKLRLYKLGRVHHGDDVVLNLRITVFWLKLRNSGVKPADQVMLDAVVTDGSKPGWVSLDVTGAVVDWHSHQHRPMALMIKVEDDRERQVYTNTIIQTLNCDNDINSKLVRLSSQPVPMFDGENILQNLNSHNQPLIDVSTIEIPDGEGIPDNLMMWGLPKKSSIKNDNVDYNGNIQNVEIRHTPALNVKVFNDTETDLNDGNNENSLTTLEEVDFMLPSGEEGITNKYFGPNGRSGFKPLATRIILSREDLEKKLNELQEQQNTIEQKEDDLSNQMEKQKQESEFFKKLFMSLMTSVEKHQVFGEDSE